jgi:hypothetical protein
MLLAFDNDRGSGKALHSLKNLARAGLDEAEFGEGLVHPLGVPEFCDLPIDDELADRLSNRSEPDLVPKDYQRQIVRNERFYQRRRNRSRPSAPQFHDDAGRTRDSEGFRVRREGTGPVVVRKSDSSSQDQVAGP